MKFLKLNKNAHTFHDSKSKVTLSNKQVVKVKGPLSKKVQLALSNGHLVEATEEEFDKCQADHEAFLKRTSKVKTKVEPAKEEEEEEDEDEDEDGDGLDELKKDQLIAKAKELPGIGENDLATISSMKKDELIEFIRNW